MRVVTFFLLALFSITIMAKSVDSRLHVETKHNAQLIKSKFFSSSNKKRNRIHSNNIFNFPTQLINFKGKIENMDCDEFFDAAHDLFLKRLDEEGIDYRASASCSGDMDEYIEIRFFSVIDLLAEEQAPYLQDYISKINGIDFYGISIAVEPLKGIILSLELNTENILDDHSTPLYSYSKALFFNNFYEIASVFDEELNSKLLGNDRELITDFINKWIDPDEVSNYLNTLSMSNSVDVQYELIFMKDKNQVYLAPFWYQYTMDCTIWPSGKCMESHATTGSSSWKRQP